MVRLGFLRLYTASLESTLTVHVYLVGAGTRSDRSGVVGFWRFGDTREDVEVFEAAGAGADREHELMVRIARMLKERHVIDPLGVEAWPWRTSAAARDRYQGWIDALPKLPPHHGFGAEIARGERWAERQASAKALQYAGESTAELLAMKGLVRSDLLVGLFGEGLRRKAARKGRAALSEPECDVVAVAALERELDHGGYGSFFRHAPEQVAHVVAALRRIGCAATARITQTAIDALHTADLSEAAIASCMSRERERRDRVLAACDQDWFAVGEDLPSALLDSIKAQRTRIWL